MARENRFPLIMKNGTEVRSLEELQENFDLKSAIGYFTDGRLQTWLADHYYSPHKRKKICCGCGSRTVFFLKKVQTAETS